MKVLNITDSIKDFSLTRCLTDGELDILVESSEIKTLTKHDHIFEYGQLSDEIYFLLEGVVKITTNTSDGREVIKMILHPKAILGEHSLAGEEIRTNNATILSAEAQFMVVKIKLLGELMMNNPKLAICIINFLGKKLKYSEERLESLVLNDARERIVDFLKVNAEKFGQPIGYEMLLRHNFTQQDIANYTGTSRQTVTTVLNDLKKKNKIHFKRNSILIRDVKSLC